VTRSGHMAGACPDAADAAVDALPGAAPGAVHAQLAAANGEERCALHLPAASIAKPATADASTCMQSTTAVQTGDEGNAVAHGGWRTVHRSAELRRSLSPLRPRPVRPGSGGAPAKRSAAVPAQRAFGSAARFAAGPDSGAARHAAGATGQLSRPAGRPRTAGRLRLLLNKQPPAPAARTHQAAGQSQHDEPPTPRPCPPAPHEIQPEASSSDSASSALGAAPQADAEAQTEGCMSPRTALNLLRDALADGTAAAGAGHPMHPLQVRRYSCTCCCQRFGALALHDVVAMLRTAQARQHTCFAADSQQDWLCAQDTTRLTRLRATRVVVHSLTAASREDLAAIARRRRQVVRDLAVLRAQLALGPERLVPRPMRATAAVAAQEMPTRGAHACCNTCSQNIGAHLLQAVRRQHCSRPGLAGSLGIWVSLLLRITGPRSLLVSPAMTRSMTDCLRFCCAWHRAATAAATGDRASVDACAGSRRRVPRRRAGGAGNEAAPEAGAARAAGRGGGRAAAAAAAGAPGRVRRQRLGKESIRYATSLQLFPDAR